MNATCIAELEAFGLDVSEAIQLHDEVSLKAAIHKAKPMLDVPALKGLLGRAEAPFKSRFRVEKRAGWCKKNMQTLFADAACTPGIAAPQLNGKAAWKQTWRKLPSG